MASMNIATWNVRTMNEDGKLENVKREMRRMKLDIPELRETRWQGNEDYSSEDIRNKCQLEVMDLVEVWRYI